MLDLDAIASTSRLRRRHPAEKLLFSGGLLAVALLAPAWPGGLLVWAAATAANLLAGRVRPRALLRVWVAPLGFLGVGALPFLASVRFGARGPALAFTVGGWHAAADATLRAGAALSALLFLATTTPLTELLLLARRCRAPTALVETALAVHDAIGVLRRAARAIRIAQGARLGYAGPRSACRSAAALWSGLLVKSLSRARRLERGLAARGFAGELRILPCAAPLTARGLLAAAGAVAAVAALAALLA